MFFLKLCFFLFTLEVLVIHENAITLGYNVIMYLPVNLGRNMKRRETYVKEHFLSYLCTKRHNIVLRHFNMTAVLLRTKITLFFAKEKNAFLGGNL